MNLNLQHNSVGFYQVRSAPYSCINSEHLPTCSLSIQLSKLACIPVTLMVQYFAYKQSVSNNVKMTLIPITFGVGYATVYDLDVNFTGLSKLFFYNSSTGH